MEAGEERDRRVRFRQRVARGEFRGLLDSGMESILAQGTAERARRELGGSDEHGLLATLHRAIAELDEERELRKSAAEW